MTMLDFHPDDLLDRARRNVPLSATERDRLRAHLAGCAVCRFVQQAARDFDDEVPVDGGGRLDLPSSLSALIDSHGRTTSVGGRRAWAGRSRRVRGIGTAVGVVLLTGIAAAAQWVGVFHRTPGAVSNTGAAPVGDATGRGHGRRRAPCDATGGGPAELACAHENLIAAADQSAEFKANPIPDQGHQGLPGNGPEPMESAHVAAGEAAAPGSVPSAGSVLSGLGQPRDDGQGVGEGGGGSIPALDGRAAPAGRAPRRTLVVVPTQQVSPPTAAGLFGQANTARRDGNAAHAVALYERLLSEFGGSAEARTSRAIIGRLLLDRGASEAALRNFDEYLAAGSGDLQEEVMVGRAGALAQLNRLEQERATWIALLRLFPRSAYAGLARSRIDLLTPRPSR